MSSAPRILVIGDSHAEVFRHETIRTAFPGVRFDVVAVGGATVSGLANPNPSSQAMPIFREALDASDADVALTLLGEVDTGFVIWYRAQKYGVPVRAMLSLALDRYKALLEEIDRRRRVIWISAALPTIGDGVAWGEVANLRREITATQAERTELTIDFNLAMAAYCVTRGFAAINLDAASLGPDGLIRETLRNADPSDHHYDRAAHVAMLRGPLLAVL